MNIIKKLIKPKTHPPLYLQQQAIRAGIAAGIALHAGASVAEVRELTFATVAETGGRPVIRPAKSNRVFKGFRYADVGMWQTSLLHAPSSALIATAIQMLNPVTGISWALSLLRSGQKFNAVAAVKNPVTPDDINKKEIVEAVMAQVELIDAMGRKPIDVSQLSEPA